MAISNKSLEAVRKLYGKESVMKLSDTGSNVKFLSSGSLYLDFITGGGYAEGRVVEIFGPESVGKTTATIHAIAEAQKAGKNAFFCDAEHAFDPDYAAKLGVNVDELTICQPDNGEQALDVTRAMIDTGEVQLAIIDSTSSLVPKAELEGEMGDAQMALQARMLSKALRMLSASVKRNNCTLIFISQLRDKLGPYGGVKIGVGEALKFYASQRIGIYKSTPIEKDGEATGHTMKFKTIKNKVYPPFKKCEVILKYGEGYDKIGEIVLLAAEMEIIKKSGSWYSYEGTKLAQGLENTISIIKDNPELHEELKGLVIEGLKQQ